LYRNKNKQGEYKHVKYPFQRGRRGGRGIFVYSPQIKDCNYFNNKNPVGDKPAGFSVFINLHKKTKDEAFRRRNHYSLTRTKGNNNHCRHPG